MKPYIWITGMFLFGLPVSAQDKEAVGEVIIGSDLPYKDELNWKNTITSGESLRLGAVRTWGELSVRAVFPNRMADIEEFSHKRSMIAMYFCAKGAKGKSIVYWNGLRRKEIDNSYARRNSWGAYVEAKWLKDAPYEGVGRLYSQPKPIDISDWTSFDLTDGGDVIPKTKAKSAFESDAKADSINLTTLKELVEAGEGKAEMIVYVIAFPYEKTERITYTTKKEVIVKGEDGKTYLVEKDVPTGYKDVYVYGKGKLLSQGTFFIIE